MSTMPWASRLAGCQTTGAVAQLWQEATTPSAISQFIETLYAGGLELTVESLKERMAADWGVRNAEIKAAEASAPSDKQIVTSKKRLEEIDHESFQATLDYGDEIQNWATAHAKHKSTRAKVYMRFKAEAASKTPPEKLTDGMAEMMTDADDEVADLYFQSELAEAKAKGAKAKLEHLDRSFRYHQSLFVREDAADGNRR